VLPVARLDEFVAAVDALPPEPARVERAMAVSVLRARRTRRRCRHSMPRR
jgi:hypothetical protein